MYYDAATSTTGPDAAPTHGAARYVVDPTHAGVRRARRHAPRFVNLVPRDHLKNIQNRYVGFDVVH